MVITMATTDLTRVAKNVKKAAVLMVSSSSSLS